jgi:diguanylate cyclase (GGDEF)-like protein
MHHAVDAAETPSAPPERRHGSRARRAESAVAAQLVAELTAALASEKTVERREGRSASAPASLAVSTWPRRAFWALGALLGAYVISAFVRSSDQTYLWLDGFGIAIFEYVVAGLCLWRAHVHRTSRVAVTALGLGLTSWATGDLLLAILSVGGGQPSAPSIADVFYLLFYPLAYVAVTLLIQERVGRIGRPNWLDGVVAGCGAAALCATFAFHDIASLTGGSHLATAVNLAYPIGDLLLLVLVIGGTVMVGVRENVGWYLGALGLVTIVAGDTANLFQSSLAKEHLGSALNSFAWPIAIFLLSLAVWIAPRPANPLRPERTSGFVAPGAGALAAFVILIVGNVRSVSGVALTLGIVTLVAVGVRLGLSAQELRRLTEERHRQAITDELTGLGNRRFLARILDEFFAGERGPAGPTRRLAFLFVDLNHFKEINDSFGHPAGDELLRQLGPRLLEAVGDHGTAVRLGGDELGVVLIDPQPDEAAEVARKVGEVVESPFALRNITTNVSASTGIALYPEDADDPTGLMWAADVAMYRAKLGKIPFVFFDQQLDGQETQVHLLDDLSDAVRNGSFVLHYQPQLQLGTGKIPAVEALIRWPHPQLGLVPPLKFLPLAEEAGLMGPLTAWVIEEALAQCRRWRATGRDIAISVNISASNLLEEGFVGLVARLIERYEIPSRNLVIEITESVIIKDFERSRTVIRQLRDMGIVVSIDDFGAGFTSLAYLSSLAVGELKLDRAFITGLSSEGANRDLELVRATINLGHEMGLRVVAEGIEDPATLDLLGDLGCDLAQGYYISRPSPADDLSFQAEVPAGSL